MILNFMETSLTAGFSTAGAQTAGDQPCVRDASVAAVMACGIQKLARHGAADAARLKIKDARLARLCSEDYLEGSETFCGGLKNGYGSRPAYSSWGDDFLTEASARELFQFKPWWRTTI
jgi:hypothetical protein